MKNKILYIDDEEFNLFPFQSTYSKYYEIFTATNTKTGEKILDSEDIKLVIIDEKMPEENGTTFIERYAPKNKKIVFIILTGALDYDTILEAINLGYIFRYINKPYNFVELKMAIDSGIEKFDMYEEKELLFEQLLDTNKALKSNVIKLEYTNEKLIQKQNELKLNQKELLESENAIKNIFNALDNAVLVCITDLEGIITQANPKFCEESGYSKHELIGKNINLVSSGFHTSEFWEDLWRTIDNGGVWRGEIKNKNKQNDYYWIDACITPIRNNEGRMYEYMMVGYQISERKLLIDQKDKLLNDLEQYAFITSHKIRGPIARLLGLINLLRNHYVKKEEVESAYELLENNTLEIDAVITKLNEVLNRNS